MNESPGPDRPRLYPNVFADESKVWTVKRSFCKCRLESKNDEGTWEELSLHLEAQDTDSRPWHRLLELIDKAVADGRDEFSPGREMDPRDWSQIVTLPPTIAKLKCVKRLVLYGSSLARIPPEIGEMSALEVFYPYTSYNLHWFPYEITRCRKLRDTRVSTRAIYGNNKYRPPFPRLPQLSAETTPKSCSVCDGPFGDAPRQAWISLLVATDVLPLLVHACSEDCLRSLPAPHENYASTAHCGGVDLVQPPMDEFYR